MRIINEDLLDRIQDQMDDFVKKYKSSKVYVDKDHVYVDIKSSNIDLLKDYVSRRGLRAEVVDSEDPTTYQIVPNVSPEKEYSYEFLVVSPDDIYHIESDKVIASSFEEAKSKVLEIASKFRKQRDLVRDIHIKELR